ncbi:MAG TPA: cell division protein FtsZ [Methylomirabilota bacterium]|nr:cell division protein FtsZ [Methylomirabilota bacterium]
MIPTNTDTSGAPLKRGFQIKVLGVGGAGCNAVSHIARTPFDGVEFIAINTDAAALAQTSVSNRLVLGEKLTRGMGAGGDPEQGRGAAEEDAARLKTLCQGADVVFIAAGMGGGTGTGASPVIARIAKECGALVLGMLVLPFEWEGGRRQRQAQLGLHEMKAAADGVICLPNQKLFKLIDEKTSMVETFAITHELLAQGVRGIWRMLMRPGLINVDFADLCSVTRGKHSENSLATAEACDENRAREVVEKLFKHPLLDGGQALTEASSVLVSIVGGPDLTMADVNRVMEQINRQCEGAHIIMGAAIEESFPGKISLTVVASKRPPAERVDDMTAGAPELERQLVDHQSNTRPPSRFVAPAPATTAEATEKMLQNGARGKRKITRLKQGQLPLEIVSKGRFEKSEPTIHHGQDLDMPTYIRRGMPLN